MPYVRRNWKGEITDIANTPQFEDVWIALPDSNPEVIAFIKKNPDGYSGANAFSKDEWKRLHLELNRAEKERRKLEAAVASFFASFSGLEGELSGLLERMLNQGRSKIGSAIYFSPTSFDARAEIVGNAVIQLASEQKALAPLLPLWTKIADHLTSVRRLRNAVAHGSALTYFTKRLKGHVKWSAPASDILRIGRKRAKNQMPGLSFDEITQGQRKLNLIQMTIQSVNVLVRNFQEQNPSLREKYAALEDSLVELRNPDA